MPSTAHKAFRYNLEDVNRLISAHAELGPTGSGRRGLGHITRSAVVMLCASWELYIEDVTVEGAGFLAAELPLPTSLPLAVQKPLANSVKSSKHELKPLELAGAGWKHVYHLYVCEKTAALNTPKPGSVDQLLKACLGLETVSASWTASASTINSFVEKRGEIAHKGRRARYVRMEDVKTDLRAIMKVASDTDNCISSHLSSAVPGTRKPWNRIP